MTRDELIDTVRWMRNYQRSEGYAFQSYTATRRLAKEAEAKVDALLAALPPTEAAPVAPVGLSDKKIDAVICKFAGGCEWSDEQYNSAKRLIRAAMLAASPATAPQASETSIDDKSHPRFIVGYMAGLHDQDLERASEKPSGEQEPMDARSLLSCLLNLLENDEAKRGGTWEPWISRIETHLASHAETAPQAPTDQFGRTPETIRFQNIMDAGDDE